MTAPHYVIAGDFIEEVKLNSRMRIVSLEEVFRSTPTTMVKQILTHHGTLRYVSAEFCLSSPESFISELLKLESPNHLLKSIPERLLTSTVPTETICEEFLERIDMAVDKQSVTPTSSVICAISIAHRGILSTMKEGTDTIDISSPLDAKTVDNLGSPRDEKKTIAMVRENLNTRTQLNSTLVTKNSTHLAWMQHHERRISLEKFGLDPRIYLDRTPPGCSRYPVLVEVKPLSPLELKKSLFRHQTCMDRLNQRKKECASIINSAVSLPGSKTTCAQLVCDFCLKQEYEATPIGVNEAAAMLCYFVQAQNKASKGWSILEVNIFLEQMHAHFLSTQLKISEQATPLTLRYRWSNSLL